MKNQRIIRAYDSINPTAIQKERMYQTILEKSSGVPVHGETKRYTGKPSRNGRKGLLGAIAACITVLILSGVVLARMSDQEQIPVYTQPAETAPPAHDALLKTYRTAMAESWTSEECLANGISPWFADTEYAKSNATYALLDIDGNGVKELIIGHGMSHYFYVLDLYTFDDGGNPVQLHSDVQDHSNCHLYKNGIIGHEYTSKTEGAYSYYKLEGTTLSAMEIMTFRNDVWYDEIAKQQVPAEEATSRLNRYEMLDIQATSLLDYAGEILVDAETTEQYMLILEKYKTALAEHWDPGKCMENGISLMVGYYGGIVAELGHNQIDLNGDGNDELIITDGTNIYDLYTIVSDEEVGPLRLIDATERSQFYLTTDGQIYNIASGSAMLSYYYLFEIGQKELVFDKAWKFDASVDPNNPWSFYEESMDKAVACTAEDARIIMDAIHFEAIPFIPFTGDTPYGESKIN